MDWNRPSLHDVEVQQLDRLMRDAMRGVELAQ
jgi:hypothetical protein